MATKKLQILDSLIKQAENADTLDGKHASEFAAAADVEELQTLVGDDSVSNQINNAISALTADEVGIYVQKDEPTNVEDGDIWVDMSADSDASTNHTHDDRYYTEEEIDSKLAEMSVSGGYIHPKSGVVAGTYRSVTVDAEGHVTDGTNPTTLEGYGITDAATKAELKEVSGLVGDDPVSEQISNVTSIYDPYGTIASAGGIAAWITATYENAEVNSY